MHAMRMLASFALLLLVVACGLPSTHHVQRVFQNEHPDYSVLGVTNVTTFPNSDFHITYTKPQDKTVHEDVWHYWHAAERWVGVKKETIE